jgi:hypothetical protein
MRRENLARVAAGEAPQPPQDLDLDAGNEHVALQTPTNLRRVGGLEKERQRLDEVGARLLDRVALARDVELRAKPDVAVMP